MKKSPKEKTKTLSISSTSNFFTITKEKASDFWWNFAYFLILSTAITFILANNPSNTLTTTPALIILGLLLCLDVFPTFYLVRTLIRYSLNRNRK